ncbi:hypothetical protein JRQ81_019645 [Phrynocephalus forsythii]|uniref:Uncharacterized protein n=1 Tax=Phrynocephalus forsythii TaxID=171643 RepID=A0A9Q0XQL2_9SAUR|nr:hypothetical protein JRQ81_019645 [Phrynocephalus forsythii]
MATKNQENLEHKEAIRQLQKTLMGAIGELKGIIQKNEQKLEQQISDLKEDNKSFKELVTNQMKEMDIKVDRVQEQARMNTKRIYEQEKQTKKLDKKTVYLEDHSRWQNLRLRGIPKNLSEGKELTEIILQWVQKVLPEIQWTWFDLERCHRVGRRNLKGPPRDILICFFNFRKKQELMNVLRLKPELLKIQDTAIQAFNDLSEQTIAWRREMKLITTILDKSIKYSWGYPVFIVIYYKDQVYRKED